MARLNRFLEFETKLRDDLDDYDIVYNYNTLSRIIKHLQPDYSVTRSDLNDDDREFMRWGDVFREAASIYLSEAREKYRGRSVKIIKEPVGEIQTHAQELPMAEAWTIARGEPIHHSQSQVVRDFFPEAIPIDSRGVPLPPTPQQSIYHSPSGREYSAQELRDRGLLHDDTCSVNCVASGFRPLKTRGTRGRGSALTHRLKISRM